MDRFVDLPGIGAALYYTALLTKVAADLIRVARFYDPLEAEIAHGLLRAAGIPSILSGEAAARSLPVNLGRLGQIDLMVRDPDGERAEGILGGLRAKTRSSEAGAAPGIRPRRSSRRDQGKTSSNH